MHGSQNALLKLLAPVPISKQNGYPSSSLCPFQLAGATLAPAVFLLGTNRVNFLQAAGQLFAAPAPAHRVQVKIARFEGYMAFAGENRE